MTPDELRSLADEATPGPWRFIPESDEYIVFAPQAHTGHAAGHGETPANTRLMALAPDLARLCAELGEALDSAIRLLAPAEQRDSPGWKHAERVLAKLSELEAR